MKDATGKVADTAEHAAKAVATGKVTSNNRLTSIDLYSGAKNAAESAGHAMGKAYEETKKGGEKGIR